MKLLLVSSFAAVCCVSSCVASDLIIGTSYNAQLMWQQNVDYIGIPFKKRVNEVFYSDPSQQIIKGVIVREASRTLATAIITAGGVGFSYVNIRFKSERGSKLAYSVELYV